MVRTQVRPLTSLAAVKDTPEYAYLSTMRVVPDSSRVLILGLKKSQHSMSKKNIGIIWLQNCSC